MRKELELMETIDNYLSGKMSEADRTAFEKKMNADPSVKKEVELQKQVLKGIERTGLKQSTKQASKKYKFNRNLKNWGLGGLAIAVIALSSVFAYKAIVGNTGGGNSAYVLPELNEEGNSLWSEADKYLPLQHFELDASKDNVVETKDGIVIAVPANSFLDAKGKPVTGTIDLEVKEALKASDILRAGLNTRSGADLLETGGMFYINARQDGESIKIDPKNPLYAEVPTDEVKPNMQLFEGKRMPDGSIDWVNPKPIRKDLIPVDITSLNFYPPSYLDSVKAFGYNEKDKRFTDSLYYAFASLFGAQPVLPEPRIQYDEAKADTVKAPSLTRQLGGFDMAKADYELGEKVFKQNCAVCHSMGKDVITGPGLAGVMARVPGEDWLLRYIKNNAALTASGDAYAKKIEAFSPSQMTVYTNLSDNVIKSIISYIKGYDRSVSMSNRSNMEGPGGINPASVKAVWNEKFNNTLLATREFEERMTVIHNTCDENVLDTYIDNLEKDLSCIDSAVMIQHPEFAKFAARGDGKVKNGNKCVEILKRYYAEKSKAYTEAIAKTVNDFRNENAKKDGEASEKKMQNEIEESNRKADNFQKEFDLNLDEAYRQLGYKKATMNLNPMPAATYGTPIVMTGWCNVDRYVLESTLTRTTLDYTDPNTGKKAVIKYEPLTVNVKDQTNYDHVLVYLLPDELNSFMRMENKSGVFAEKLNELMSYKMVCIAYKGEESFYYSQDNVKPGTLSVSLIKTTNAEITNNINKLGKLSHVKAMNDELNYMAFEKEDAKRKAYVAKIYELTNKIEPVIFPCMSAIYTNDSTQIEEPHKF